MRGKADAPPTGEMKLSRWEREIVTLLAVGCTHQEIGEAMGYAKHTMKNRVSGTAKRIGVRGLAARYAWRVLAIRRPRNKPGETAK